MLHKGAALIIFLCHIGQFYNSLCIILLNPVPGGQFVPARDGQGHRLLQIT
jgi:hypothetical protein